MKSDIENYRMIVYFYLIFINYLLIGFSRIVIYFIDKIVLRMMKGCNLMKIRVIVPCLTKVKS